MVSDSTQTNGARLVYGLQKLHRRVFHRTVVHHFKRICVGIQASSTRFVFGLHLRLYDDERGSRRGQLWLGVATHVRVELHHVSLVEGVRSIRFVGVRLIEVDFPHSFVLVATAHTG